MSVEVITKEALIQLRRHARLEKKKESERMLNTTLRDVIAMWHADYSAFCATLAQSGTRHETQLEKSVVPELPSDEVVGPYEDKYDIMLLLFARDAGASVLVNFGWKPSKLFENKLRHSAKIRALTLHFYRLIGGYFAIEVEPKSTPAELDASFLKTLGIKEGRD